jgi:UDP-N-acetylglucosamine 1-carboxyvinyltransferase
MDTHSPYYLIEGGAPLHGEVCLSGAKNAVTKMVMASLLTNEQCTLRNVPLLGDLDLALALCRDIGSEVTLQDHTLAIRTPCISKAVVSSEMGGLNRMAVLTVGPLLHRCGEANFPMPGGDRIGKRPIDFHLNGLREMGAEIIERNGRYHCTAPDGLHGATIQLPVPSVMATETSLSRPRWHQGLLSFRTPPWNRKSST